MLSAEHRERIRDEEIFRAAVAKEFSGKRSRFIAVLNAPFFLLMVSSVFLSVGAAYIATSQQCYKDAFGVYEAYIDVGRELDRRMAEFSGAISAYGYGDVDQKNWDADRQKLLGKLSGNSALDSALKQVPFPALEARYSTLRSKMEISKDVYAKVVERSGRAKIIHPEFKNEDGAYNRLRLATDQPETKDLDALLDENGHDQKVLLKESIIREYTSSRGICTVRGIFWLWREGRHPIKQVELVVD